MAQTICVPMKLDAFVLNPDVCNGPDAKIPPISQPNYTFLRLDHGMIQNDVQPQLDLHASTPWQCNRRLMDVGTNTPHIRRQGVYVHWTLPRFYRSGTAATPGAAQQRQAQQQGQQGYAPPEDPTKADYSAPAFRSVPTRWLVVRKILRSDPPNVLPPAQGWVIDSDWRQDLDSLPDSKDLQVDVSPFVQPTKDTQDSSQIDQQAEIFIGNKTAADSWDETNGENRKADRVPLTLLNSGNPLFADFQPHNSNVFSMVDNFSYGPNDSLVAKSAVASYYVIGWHSIAATDPFAMSSMDNTNLAARAKACQVQLYDSGSPTVTDWGNVTSGCRVLCHGAMYDVEWNISGKPTTVLADKAFQTLHTNQPVAVGTTPLDALFAYVSANIGKDPDTDLLEVETDLQLLQQLLVAQDDGVDSLSEAADMLYNHNFDKTAGGSQYHLSGDDGTNKPTIPAQAVQDRLANLNALTMACDTARRRAQRLQWDLFSVWWKYVSDPGSAATQSTYKNCVDGLVSKLTALNSEISAWQGQITEATGSDGGLPPLVCGVQEPFFQQRDPTLLLAGVRPGWPLDYLDNLKARLRDQLVTDSNNIGIDPDVEHFSSTTLATILKTLPSDVLATAQRLLREFSLLQPEAKSFNIPNDQSVPLYHDQEPKDSEHTTPTWRDRWGSTQPWAPLFLEWEIEYTHIPYEWWVLEPRRVGGATSQTTQSRYGMRNEATPLWEKILSVPKDTRTLSGRVLMLPQPGFSLKGKLEQLFTNNAQAVAAKISVEEQGKLLAKLSSLTCVSAPMAGLISHLVTQATGTHVKPNIRRPGQAVAPLKTAWRTEINMNDTSLGLMGLETDLTPYGTLVEALGLDVAAFKPCTHGQFKFTKLNVIDKFGQAIHAIDPSPSVHPKPSLYPCASDYYTCQNLPGTNTANAVERPTDLGCQYVQINPMINQMSRLNMSWVIGDKDTADHLAWRPATEWENPIWGWLVVNYADYGLQIFLPDGRFYLEVRLGGPEGTELPPDPWQPFAAPDGKTPATDHRQLDALVQALRDKDYLQCLFDMLSNAFNHLKPAPGSYAQCLSSLIGRPLALVNFGVSLELAVDPYRNQSTTNVYQPRIPLLPPGSLEPDCQACEPKAVPAPVPKPPQPPPPPYYSFDVKLGDKIRTYDGLVGYFDAVSPPAANGSNLDLSALYTYFPAANTLKANPTKDLAKVPLPQLTPFFLRPDGMETKALVAARNAYLTVFGGIVDPFTPIHAYTGMLPIRTLALPPWAVGSALDKMTAFFHLGPLLTTVDAPTVFEQTYEPKDALDETLYAGGAKGGGIGIPTLPPGDWAWLQPYYTSAAATSASLAKIATSTGSSLEKHASTQQATVAATATNMATRFMALPISASDTSPRYEDGPYTAFEGYLQLRKTATSANGA